MAFAGLAPAWSLCLGILSFQLDVQYRGWSGSSLEGGSFWQGGFYLQPRVRAGGAGQQRVHNPRPLSISFPSLSMWTSQLGPRRQSREGFGGGLLKSRLGEAKS